MNKKNFFGILCLFMIQGCDAKDHKSPTSANNSFPSQCIIKQISDVPKQMPCLKANAEAGSAIDQYNLAIALKDGINGEPNNPEESFFWMTKAAESGRADAQLNLGIMYLDAFGVNANREQAMLWLNKALANGRNEAYTNIGRVHEEMLPINKKLAFQNYQKSADAGSEFAKAHLGRCYLFGIGTSIDREKGLSLLNDAANQGIEFAQNIMIQAYINGVAVPQNYQTAFELSQKYAQLENTSAAFYNLGVMYEQGWGTEVNHQKSAEYFRKASEQNNIPAKYNLALMLWEGKYIDKNEEEAINLFKTAAENNCGKAMESLTHIFSPNTEVHKFWQEERKKLQKYQDICAV